MEAIKKKLATLKQEKEDALEKLEEAKEKEKNANEKADEVSVTSWDIRLFHYNMGSSRNRRNN